MDFRRNWFQKILVKKKEICKKIVNFVDLSKLRKLKIVVNSGNGCRSNFIY